MTEAAHAIPTARYWRSTPFSPISAVETAAICVVAMIFAGVMVMHARAAMESAQASAAAAEIRMLNPIVGAYGLENSGYTGMTSAALKREYGARLDSTVVRTLKVTGATASSFCVQIRDGSLYAAQQGPSGAIETSRSPICR